MLATARLLGQRFLMAVRTAWQTLTAGRAFRGLMTLTGNPYFAGTTPLPPQHANPQLNQKPEVAPQTSLEQKIGNVNQLAQTLTAVQSLGLGLGSVTAVPPTRQPAKPAAKPAKKAASKTKPVAKRTPAKAPAKTRTARQSGRTGK